MYVVILLILFSRVWHIGGYGDILQTLKFRIEFSVASQYRGIIIEVFIRCQDDNEK